MSGTDESLWKVGELASATRLTVRALHHYDELGLLVPSERTGAGHRLYSADDVRRLYRIVALRQLGLPLSEIAALLDDEDLGLIETVRRHLERVERELERQERLRRRLNRILDALGRSAEPSIDDFIDALEMMTMVKAILADVLVPVFGEPEGEKPGRIPGEGQPVMLLREQDGSRVLPIWIGHPEASALALRLAGKALPRPLTQDLMASLIEAAGAQVDRICIGRFGENTFYAAVSVTTEREPQEVDARPSDALNLAVRVDAPVFVDARVMEEWAVPSPEEVESRLTQCGGRHRDRDPNRKAPSGWRSLVSAVAAAPSQPAS